MKAPREQCHRLWRFVPPSAPTRKEDTNLGAQSVRLPDGVRAKTILFDEKPAVRVIPEKTAWFLSRVALTSRQKRTRPYRLLQRERHRTSNRRCEPRVLPPAAGDFLCHRGDGCIRDRPNACGR